MAFPGDDEPTNEPENPWVARMTVGLDHLTAIPEFCKVVQGGSLPAQNPRGGHLKPVRVAFDLVIDADHILFKSPGDTHGRQNKGQHLPQDFQQARADRLGWIPHVLLKPDAIYADKRSHGDFGYVSKTLPGEEFLIVIHEKETPRGACYFITAYEMTLEEWAAKRQERFIKVYPANSTSGKQGGGRKIPKRKKR